MSDDTSSLDHAYADSRDAYRKIESPASRAKREMKSLQAQNNRQGEYEFHGEVSFQKGSDGKTVVLINPDEGRGFGTPPFQGYRWINQFASVYTAGQFDAVIGGNVDASNTTINCALLSSLLLNINNAVTGAGAMLAAGMSSAEFFANLFTLFNNAYQFILLVENAAGFQLKNTGDGTTINMNTSTIPGLTADFRSINFGGAVGTKIVYCAQ